MRPGLLAALHAIRKVTFTQFKGSFNMSVQHHLLRPVLLCRSVHSLWQTNLSKHFHNYSKIQQHRHFRGVRIRKTGIQDSRVGAVIQRKGGPLSIESGAASCSMRRVVDRDGQRCRGKLHATSRWCPRFFSVLAFCPIARRHLGLPLISQISADTGGGLRAGIGWW